MALVACPECQTQVSTLATTCPKCGAPVSAVARGETQALGQQVTTTEQTSKSLKGRMAIAVIVMIASIVVLFAMPKNPDNMAWYGVFVLAFVASGIYYFYIKLKIWWHHR